VTWPIGLLRQPKIVVSSTNEDKSSMLGKLLTVILKQING
jgi:hypothetical protein